MTRTHRKRRRLMCIVAFLMIAGLAAAGCSAGLGIDLQRVATSLGLDSKPVDGDIEASGTIEAEQVIISSELSGRIVRVHVSEGQSVERGQILVELDDSLLTTLVTGAQADLEAAEAELARVLAGPRQAQVAGKVAAIEQAKIRAAGARQAWDDTVRLYDNPLELDAQIRASESEVRLAEVRVDQAKAQLAEVKVRYEASKGGGSDAEKTTTEILRVQVEATRAGVDLAELAVQGARGTLTELRRLRENRAAMVAVVHQAEMGYRLAVAEIAVKEAKLELLEAGPLPEEIALAERKVDLARAAQESLRVQREKLTLRSPIAGVVATRVASDGETAVAGATLLTVVDLARVRLTIYVPESQIGHVKLGEVANVQIDTYPDRLFQGQVVYISPEAEFTPRNIQTTEDRVNTVFAVKIALDNTDGTLKPGMPADATIEAAR